MPTTKYTLLAKKRASLLRNSSTIGEIILWKHLKKKQLVGLDFNRQKPLGIFIADFYNCKYKIVIEVDGNSHDCKQEYDMWRETILKEQEISIIRVKDKDVKQNITGVMEYLEAEVVRLLNTLPRSLG